MNAPNEHIEDRLRRALAARAEQVTPSSLQAATPVSSTPPRKATWRAPMLAAAAAATVLVAGVTYAALNGTVGQPAPGPATAPPRPKVVTGSTCARESALVGAALRRDEGVPADVDGDGAPDRVVVAADEHGEPGCRAFVGVRTATGTTYSTAMGDVFGRRLPPFPPEVIGVPVLGRGTGAEIVVDTHARADGALAQLFTLTDAGLVQVMVPGGEDGTFLVEGGGISAPQGAGCRADGTLVVSGAAIHGQSFDVTQRSYSLTGDRLSETGSTTRKVPGNDLAKQFPEFLGPHFKACGGEVRGR